MSVLQTIDLKKYYGTEPNITRAGGQPEMAVRRVLFCRQHNGKFRTLARLRNHLDIAALSRYDLAGQI